MESPSAAPHRAQRVRWKPWKLMIFLAFCPNETRGREPDPDRIYLKSFKHLIKTNVSRVPGFAANPIASRGASDVLHGIRRVAKAQLRNHWKTKGIS